MLVYETGRFHKVLEPIGHMGLVDRRQDPAPTWEPLVERRPFYMGGRVTEKETGGGIWGRDWSLVRFRRFLRLLYTRIKHIICRNMGFEKIKYGIPVYLT